MTTRRLVFWIIMLAVFAMAARISVDTDTWWHLRAGKWMVENRQIIQTDYFSYTRAGEPWQYPGWLVEIPMYGIYRAFGPGGLNLWTALMVALAFFFVWQTMSGGPFLRAFVLVLAAAASGVYWAARPYLVTFVLAAVFLWLFEKYRDRSINAKVLVTLLPVLMIVWVNSHGGFAAGFLIWGVYLTGELVAISWMWLATRTRRAAPASQTSFFQREPVRRAAWLVMAGGLLVLAVCINPSGPVMLAYPFKTIGIGALQEYIQEWQSPDFHSLSVQPFAWLLFVTLGAAGVSRRRLALTDFLLVSGFAYMGLLAARNIALFSLAAPMVITRHLDPALAAVVRAVGLKPTPAAVNTRGQKRLNLVILALIGVTAFLKLSLVFPEQVNRVFFVESLPVEAVQVIKAAQPAGRLFNSYNWGGYLVWALPEYPVFLDGRTDLYNDEIISQWLQVARAEPGWETILEDWDVGVVLLEKELPVVSRLRANGWQELFADDRGIVLQR